MNTVGKITVDHQSNGASRSEYLGNIIPNKLAGIFIEKTWNNQLHGDRGGQSPKHKLFAMKTTNGTYIVQVREDGHTVLQLEYDMEPSLVTVGQDLNLIALNKRIGIQE